MQQKFDLFLKKMNEFNNRIVQIADYYKLSRASDFAKKTGFSHQTASNYLKGERIPTAESLKTIQQTFDKINADWLLTGRGSMLKGLRTTDVLGNLFGCEFCAEKDQKIQDLQSKLIDCQERTINLINNQKS
jgi:transcriptional regulator with XRE-family HTH domain